jgi:hypothetical protein
MYELTGRKYKIPGRDHAKMLIYLQTVVANYGGLPMNHNDGQHMSNKFGPHWSGKYSSRKWDGTKFENHDDIDCIDDLEELGIIESHGTRMNPFVEFTELAHKICGEFLDERQGKHHDKDFVAKCDSIEEELK